MQIDIRRRLRNFPQHRLGIDLDILEMLLGERPIVEVQTVYLVEGKPETYRGEPAELVGDILVLIGNRCMAEFENQVLRKR